MMRILEPWNNTNTQYTQSMFCPVFDTEYVPNKCWIAAWMDDGTGQWTNDRTFSQETYSPGRNMMRLYPFPSQVCSKFPLSTASTQTYKSKIYSPKHTWFCLPFAPLSVLYTWALLTLLDFGPCRLDLNSLCPGFPSSNMACFKSIFQ